MRILNRTTDGGPESNVTAYFLIECKSILSIALLRFDPVNPREAFHDHAFNAWTFMLSGCMEEERLFGIQYSYRKFKWKFTPRNAMHKVVPKKVSWALTFRGPWCKSWRELRGSSLVTLTKGRREVESLDLKNRN